MLERIPIKLTAPTLEIVPVDVMDAHVTSPVVKVYELDNVPIMLTAPTLERVPVIVVLPLLMSGPVVVIGPKNTLLSLDIVP